jgi:hypothetical protein
MRTILFFALLLLPTAAWAQQNGQFIPLTTLPGIKEFGADLSLAPLLSQIYKMCIGIAAVLAVLQLMRAGVMYMGGDSITEKKQARELIGLSIAGLLLVLSPVIVFGIINPQILNLDLTNSLEKLNTSVAPAPGTSGNPSPSTIDATGAVNEACKPMPDGTVITGEGSKLNLAEQCCVRQKVGGVACTLGKYTDKTTYNIVEYCSCPGK